MDKNLHKLWKPIWREYDQHRGKSRLTLREATNEVNAQKSRFPFGELSWQNSADLAAIHTNDLQISSPQVP